MNRTTRTILTGLAMGLAATAQAVTATWTNTANGTVEYWTNNANWSASPYPGSSAANSAYLTNAAAGTYAAVLNTPLANSISTLVISNAVGQAWLNVTNAVLTNTTLTLGSGGWVQLDNGSITNVSTLNALGTNSNLRLNTGGALFTTANFTFGTSLSGLKLLVDSASPFGAAGAWNLGGKRLYIGNSAATGNVLTINGAVVTNVGDGVMMGFAATAINNTLIVTNGGRIWNTGNDCSIGNAAGANGNAAYVVGSNSTWNIAGKSLTVGLGNAATGNLLWVDGGTISLGTALTVGGTAGANYNTATFTNGAQLRTGASSYIGPSTGFGSTGNTVRVVGGAGGVVSLWNPTSPSLQIGVVTGSVGNALLVDASGVVTGVQVTVGVGAGSTGNAVTISAGGQLNFGGTMTIGSTGGASNLLTVTGAGALLRNTGQSQQYIGNGAAGNVFRIDNGGLATNFYDLYIGYNGGSGNSLIVSNGGVLATVNPSYVGSSASSNTAFLSGLTSRWDQAGYALTVGANAGAVGNNLIIANGSALTNAGGLAVGSTGGMGNSFVVTNGGQFSSVGAVDLKIGDRASSNTAWIGGNGAVVAGLGRSFYVGSAAATGNVVVVDNGGSLASWTTVFASRSPGGVGNMLIVTNGGQVLVASAGQVRVAYEGSNSFNNVLLVVNGGLLEANNIWINSNCTGPASGNIVTNAGGIYQFTTAAPTITLSNNAMMYLSSGTIAFRALTNADVTCNKKGGALDATSLMSFAGRNGFRLNNATNSGTGQSYTFTDTLGATNFYRLELLNGSQYRGGPVTIGTNGWLYVSGGVSTIASTLTFSAGSTLEFDLSSVTNGSALTALAGVALNGCALKLNLGSAPTANDTGLILNKQSAGPITGQFAGGGLASATCNGTSYTFRVQYAAGAGGNSVSLTYVPTVKGTALLFR